MMELPLLNNKTTDFSLCPRIPKSGGWVLLCYRLAASSPGSTQLDALLWGHFMTQVTQIRPTARLWELCKWVTRAFGQVRRTRTVRNAVAVTKKYRNFGSFLGMQEQKARQQRNASRGKEELHLQERFYQTASDLWLSCMNPLSHIISLCIQTALPI